jgi:hypothetical protein
VEEALKILKTRIPSAQSQARTAKLLEFAIHEPGA